jgi:hypothetical protein
MIETIYKRNIVVLNIYESILPFKHVFFSFPFQSLPAQNKSAVSSAKELNVKGANSLFLLPGTFNVNALYRRPNDTPKAAKMDRRANSTGTPSGQCPYPLLAAPTMSSWA